MQAHNIYDFNQFTLINSILVDVDIKICKTNQYQHKYVYIFTNSSPSLFHC